MKRDEILTGWLVILRHQFDHGRVFDIPTAVREGMVDRGWMTLHEPETDDRGLLTHSISLTPAGIAHSDIHAPEWGIDSIPEDSDA